MNNLSDIADKNLDVLHGQLTKVMMDFREFTLNGLVLYRKSIPVEDAVKVTFTTLYITNVLTSGLAKLYMLRGYVHNEITKEELTEHLKSITDDMADREDACMYHLHKKLNGFVKTAEDLDKRINHVASGGIY